MTLPLTLITGILPRRTFANRVRGVTWSQSAIWTGVNRLSKSGDCNLRLFRFDMVSASDTILYRVTSLRSGKIYFWRSSGIGL